ncbi:aspartyl protease family protein [Pleurocapsales cyanobacterium LEGE 06147]|nr:aspartyl protease family protein [Pleurocapsales cyanobacterium LEGE 06147]
MKTFLKLFILSIAINFIPLFAHAQSEQVCFMLDVHGKPMDLSHLCRGSTNNSNMPNRASTQQRTSGVFTAPIKRREFGIPVIDVKFNDRHTFEMLLDTGASFTMLTPGMAKTLAIKQEGIMLVNTPSDRMVEVPTSSVASAAVAGAVSTNMVVAISSSLPLGLLGQNFFGHYDVTIKQDVIEFRLR